MNSPTTSFSAGENRKHNTMVIATRCVLQNIVVDLE